MVDCDISLQALSPSSIVLRIKWFRVVHIKYIINKKHPFTIREILEI